MNLQMIDYVKLSSEKLEFNFSRNNDLCKVLCDEYVGSGKRGIRIIASGSSYNSSMAARNYMQDKLKESVKVVSPDVFINFENHLPENMFNIVISQSGCSTNVIECLKFMKNKGFRCIVLTGNTGSDIKDYADVLIDYGVGIETVGYVTMGVVTLIEFLMLFALQSAALKGRINLREKQFFLKRFENAILNYSEVVKTTENFIEKNKIQLSQVSPTFICGNGPNYGVALEGTLKFQETLKIPTMVYATEEFIHGPNMQLTPNYSAYIIDDPIPRKRVYCIYRGVREITDKTYFITMRNDLNDDHCIAIPKIEDADIIPILNVVIFQYIAAKMTDELDLWNVHPYVSKVEKLVSIKTDDYLDVQNKLKNELKNQ